MLYLVLVSCSAQCFRNLARLAACEGITGVMVRAAVIFSVALASKPIAEPDPDLRDVIARLEASRVDFGQFGDQF